jgi:glycosyltransferase involved in cell wall biosynthesis
MKVLMTADAVGGVWTYALDLAAGLSQHGVDVVLAVLGPAPSPAQREAAGRIPSLELVESGTRLEWMPNPWRDVDAAGECLLRLAAERRVDLVHLNGYAHAALPWQRPVMVVAHSCVVTWWRAVHGSDPPAEWDEYRRRVAAGLAAASAVVAPTRAFLRRLRAAYGPSWHAEVVPNGRDASAHVEARRPRRDDVVFACGRLWDEAKDLRLLDGVARQLRWPVHIAGDTTGPSGRGFEPAAARCLGALPADAIAVEMGRAALFAHPSRYEPFGLAPLEAAHAGCALVLADLPELRELWDGAATFVPPGDAAAWASALGALIDDPDRRRESAEAAVARAADHGAAAMAAAYAASYRRLHAAANEARAVA